jgi:hypothetical protein
VSCAQSFPLLATNKFPEFDAANDSWWQDYLNAAHTHSSLKERDSPQNMCLRCRKASHASIIAYPTAEDQLKYCLVPSCGDLTTIDLVASLIMQTHYTASELIEAKNGEDFINTFKTQLATKNNLPAALLEAL